MGLFSQKRVVGSVRLDFQSHSEVAVTDHVKLYMSPTRTKWQSANLKQSDDLGGPSQSAAQA